MQYVQTVSLDNRSFCAVHVSVECELYEGKALSIVPLQGPGEPKNSLSAGKHSSALGDRAVLSALSSPPCTREAPLINLFCMVGHLVKFLKGCFCFYFQKKRRKKF